MLKLLVPIGAETYDEATNKFVYSDYFTLELEHSLASLSKWEAKYERPFLSDKPLSSEESLFYVEHCMLLTQNPPEGIFQRLSHDHVEAIEKYINGKQSATWFKETNKSRGRQIITAAVIEGWMVALRIPFDARDWHLNRLFDLIRVCNEQQTPPKKMSRAEAARQQAALNARRQAEMGTKG